MRIYRARIIGFKRSKTMKGYYHPIFEYTDAYREKRRYIRETSMERTPFTANKKYTICKHARLNRIKTYEKTEKPIPLLLYLFLLSIIARIVSMIDENAGLYVTIFATICLIGRHVGNVMKAMGLQKRKNKLTPIQGRIVGYQEFERKVNDKKIVYESHPIIEYVYKDRTYQHVSKMPKQCIGCKIDQACDIYVDPKHSNVFDEFEMNTSICFEIIHTLCPQYFLLTSLLGQQFEDAEIEGKEKQRNEQKREIHGVIPPIRRAG